MDDNAVEERDRLSELPDSLILLILSLLPMSDVVSTTLLSKRWNNVWTTATCLNFCCKVTKDGAKEEKIRNFFNRALIFWKGPTIQKFGIHLHDCFEKSLSVDVDLWVHFAVVNKVEDLNISLWYQNKASDWEDRYWVPPCLNLCSSLRHLLLEGCNLRMHEPPSWDHLKSLKMDGYCLDERSIYQILLGCPKLEVLELRLLESNENLTIHSKSLKVVKIEKMSYFEKEPSSNTMLRICCPNLKTLEISGVLYSKCLFTNVSSLTDVTLGFCNKGFDDTRWKYCLGQTLIRIFSSFQHVERVTLSNWYAEVLGELQEEYLPSPLPSVKFLKLNDVYITKLGDMMDLFGIFPNLEMLVFEDLSAPKPQQLNANNYLEFGTIFSKFLLMQLKKVVITSHDLLDSSIARFMEFLLKHASVLEEFVIRDKNHTSSSKPGWCLLKVAQTLLSMPRSSPTAKVIFNNEWETREQLCSVCGM